MNRLALVALLGLAGCAHPGYAPLPANHVYRPIVMPQINVDHILQPVQNNQYRPIQFDPVPPLKGPSTTECRYVRGGTSCVTY